MASESSVQLAWEVLAELFEVARNFATNVGTKVITNVMVLGSLYKHGIGYLQ